MLHHLTVFDKKMNSMVIDAKILEGASVESIKKTSEGVVLRHGSVETLVGALDTNMHVAVISVNWSSDLIKYTLDRHGFTSYKFSDDGEEEGRGDIRIVANDLRYDVHGGGTGAMERRCEGAVDKVNMLNAMRAQLFRDVSHACIYVGDSITDIGALMVADIGILFVPDASTAQCPPVEGSSMYGHRMVLKILDRAGVPVRPLDELIHQVQNCMGADIQNSTPVGKVVYWTSSWKEVTQLVHAISIY